MPDRSIYKLHANIRKALAHPIPASYFHGKQILIQRKEGMNVYYRLSSKKVATACRIMREVLIENLEKHKEILKTL